MLHQLLKGNTTTIILAMLKDEPMYGYQLVKEIERRSKSLFSLKEGTVYPLLHDLERQGLVEGRWERRGNRPSRKYYHLTPKGEKALAVNVAEWHNFSSALEGLLGGGA